MSNSPVPMGCLALCIDVSLRNTLVKSTESQDWISRTSRASKGPDLPVMLQRL